MNKEPIGTITHRLLLGLAVIIAFTCNTLQAQSDSSLQQAAQSLNALNTHSLQALEKKYNGLEKLLQKQSQQMLKRMQRREAKLQKKLKGKDSVAARKMLEQSQQKYKELETRLNSTNPSAKFSLKEYVPGLDSLRTGMGFLEQAKGKIPGLPADKLEQVQSLNKQIKSLETQLQQANDIKAFVKERQQQLKDQLGKYDLGKQLGGLNKDVYYYQQQLQEYKDLVNNREKLEEKALAALREVPAFKSFMQQNSYLSQLFPATPGSSNGTGLAGLQTRTQVQQLINQRLGIPAGSTVAGGNPLQSQLQAAQGQMDQLKDKVNQLGGGSSDMAMPDGFKPNSQKTKSFLQRLEYGFNVQTQRSNNLLPSISDLGLTVGYKINDKSTIGVGASYKLGWGKPFNDIRFSSEGVGLRSFIDVKAKGSIWVTGGYELNYLQSFSKLDDLKKPDVWQRSGLLGLTKKYKVGKKQGNLQLLWDFLSYSQVPKASAIKFRVGYQL